MHTILTDSPVEYLRNDIFDSITENSHPLVCNVNPVLYPYTILYSLYNNCSMITYKNFASVCIIIVNDLKSVGSKIT